MSNIWRLLTVTWCQTSKVRRLIWDDCCHIIIVIRRLMSFVFYQTSDIRQITLDVWCETFVIRCLLSYNNYCYHTSDVWFYILCYITVIKCLMLPLFVMLCNCHQTSGIRHDNVRCLMFVTWWQSSSIRRLMSDTRCLMCNIRLLIFVAWHQMSDIRRLMSYVW